MGIFASFADGTRTQIQERQQRLSKMSLKGPIDAGRLRAIGTGSISLRRPFLFNLFITTTRRGLRPSIIQRNKGSLKLSAL